MKFTTLGRTGEEISAIGFGAMPLSIQGRPPEDVGRAVIKAVINADIGQIDIASTIVEVQSVQNRLNPYFRDSIEVAAECGRRKITFLAYSPVGGSRLAKKIPELPIVKKLAAQHGCSPHAVVLAWVRSKGETVVPIPGARSPEHAVDSARSVEVTLTAEEIEEIDR